MATHCQGVVLDLDTLAPADLDLTPITSLPVNWQLYGSTCPDQIKERIKNAHIVLTNKVVLGQVLLEQAEALRYIGVLATGTNNIDKETAARLNIPVLNVTNYGTASVVQHTMMLMLSLATRQGQYQQALRRGAWQQSHNFCLLDYPIMELAGKKLLIIGYGTLGQGVARVAQAFGMEILRARVPGSASTDGGRIDLHEGLAQADVVSLHCPLTETTRHLLNRERLSLMQPHSLLINTARGGLVEPQALLEALHQGRIAGAGLDVLDVEPPEESDPLLAADLPNLLITPHNAWGSRESRQRLVELVGANVQEWLQQQARF